MDSDSDLYKTWITLSKKIHKPILKGYPSKCVAKYFMHIRDLLHLEKEVYFKALAMFVCYDKAIRREKVRVHDPLLVMMVMVLICNKLHGQKTDSAIDTAIKYLRKMGLTKCTHDDIKKVEIEVISKLNYQLPLTTMLDDLDTLFEIYIKPLHSSSTLHKQCQNILTLISLYFKNLTNVLTAIYKFRLNVEEIKLIKSLYTSKLYIPAGVILCTVKLCGVFKQLDYDDISQKISNHISVASSDLNLLANIMHKIVMRCVNENV